MCGIAGIVGESPEGSIADALKSLHHRGPDDEGVYRNASRHVALIHKRLSIIDLSSLGHQPMSYDAGRYWITYNGEIYNYVELRDQLRVNGFTFISNSDTEVLLAGYACWKEGMLSRLRGMFAFGIWDEKEGSLFLARDRFGIKPLYYTQASGIFAFASEVQALRAIGMVRPIIDKQSLWDYLSFGAIPQPRTILADVRALLPGHSLTLRNSRLATRCFWDIEEATRGMRADLRKLSYEEAVLQLREHLEDATRFHLVSDVPVGAFLSGGIDSTAVVGLMSQLAQHPIKTYSIGFETEARQPDELKWARLAADRFGLDHHEVIISRSQIGEAFEGFMTSIDQPSSDGFNSYLVAEAARKGVKVALSGLGGDELFMGYPHFSYMSKAHFLAPDGIEGIRDAVSLVTRFVPGRWREGLRMIPSMPSERFERIRRMADESERREIANPRWVAQFNPLPLRDRYKQLMRKNLDIVTQLSYVELCGYLRDTLLRDSDVLSMAHSLEVRPVLLDHKLAEFVFSLPPSFKLAHGVGKRILIDALGPLLPRDILRRRKMGFELPLMYWMKSSLRERALDIFSSDTAAEVFSPHFTRGVLAQFEKGGTIGFRTWAYFVLLEYMRQNNLHLFH